MFLALGWQVLPEEVKWLFLEYPLLASLQAWRSSHSGPGSLAWEWPSR